MHIHKKTKVSKYKSNAPYQFQVSEDDISQPLLDVAK